MRIPVDEVGFDDNSLLKVNNTIRITKQENPVAELIKNPLPELPSSGNNLITMLDSKENVVQETNTTDKIPETSLLKESRVPTVNGKAMISVPSLPQTSFQFQADVKKLRSHLDKLSEYLLQISPQKLPLILKQQLDADILLLIVKAFNNTACQR